jgi:hypothetical protein
VLGQLLTLRLQGLNLLLRRGLTRQRLPGQVLNALTQRNLGLVALTSPCFTRTAAG